MHTSRAQRLFYGLPDALIPPDPVTEVVLHDRVQTYFERLLIAPGLAHAGGLYGTMDGHTLTAVLAHAPSHVRLRDHDPAAVLALDRQYLLGGAAALWELTGGAVDYQGVWLVCADLALPDDVDEARWVKEATARRLLPQGGGVLFVGRAGEGGVAARWCPAPRERLI